MATLPTALPAALPQLPKLPSLARFGYARLLAALLFLAFLCPALTHPAFAFAQEAPDNPCALSDKMRDAYAADGTLENRMAYAEALGHERADSGLVQQALARDAAARGKAQVPEASKSGMATEGQAYVFVLHVDFPDMQFAKGDTLEATRAMFDGNDTSPSVFPYEDLQSFYQRSSYGKLIINVGDARAYTAQYDRSYYTGNEDALFVEALAAFDDEIDYSQFDGNGDGYIDAVYIHFAGENTGWGSTWWSSEYFIPDDYEGNSFDGVKMRNRVLLHQPSNTELGVRTAIHETGHVLGLPDYYSSGTYSTTAGILTFDMMKDNTGDHCGFSKWMLGWIPEENIVHVVANDEGMTIRRESEAAAAPYDGSELSLGAFTSDTLAETGGIITVSNEDGGIFSSYYLLQYDVFAGNQSVQYAGANDMPTDLSSGFRLYRIQAGLNDEGTDFALHNIGGKIHDQLIELVDPDEGQDHLNWVDGCVYGTSGQDPYGCMWYAGDSITPTSEPVSTNFNENINVGFTGITLNFARSDAASGAVSVAYSDEHKPVLGDFSITPAFSGASNMDMLDFTMSSQAELARINGNIVTPYYEVDGSIVYVSTSDFSVSGTSIQVEALFDPGFVTPESTFEIVFPQGMFIIGKDTETGAPVYSEEVRVPLAYDSAVHASGALTTVSPSGALRDLEFLGDVPVLSHVLAGTEGKTHFFQADDGKLLLHTLAADDPSRVERTWEVAEGVHPTRLEHATELSNGNLFVVLYDEYANEGRGESTCYWVDPKTNVVVATYALEEQVAQLFSAGNSMVGVLYAPGSSVNVLFDPRDNGTVATHYAATPSDDILVKVSTDLFMRYELASDGTSWFASVTNMKVYDSNALVDALRQAPTNLDDGLEYQASIPESALRANLAGSLTGYHDVRATYRDGFFTVLALGFEGYENLLVRYDAQGNEVARKNIGVVDGTLNTSLRAAEHGSVAVVYEENIRARELCKSYRAKLFDGSLNEASSVVMAGTGVGTWLESGAWLCVGFGVQDYIPGAHGAPALEDAARAEEISETALRYAVTDVIDKADPNVPPTEEDVPGQPEQNPGQETSGAAGGALPKTGDPVHPALPLCLLGLSAAGAFVALAARRSREERQR